MPLQFARIHTWSHRLTRWVPFRFTLPHLIVIATLLCGSMVSSPARAQAPTANPSTKPSIVAVVNADPITRKTLADAATERYGSDVLDNMVNRHLILQACASNGIEVTKQQVTEEIQRLASKFGLSMDSYLKLLQEERDIDPNQYSREIIWPMLALRRLVADQVEVGQEEFNRAYMSQFGEAIKCRLIMTSSHGKATQILAQAKANPASFASLAKQFSEDEASMSVGGLIPPIRRYNGDSRLEETAFALKDNEVSDILQLGDQWVILQAVRRIPESHPSPQAMPAIREQITDRLRDEKMRQAAAELFTKLQQDAKVVKVIGDEEKSRQYPGVAALINGQSLPISQVATECVKRHGEEVLEGEINRKLLVQALRSAKIKVNDEDLQSEIAAAAVKYGFVRKDGTADAAAWMESVTAGGKVSESVYIADSVWPSVALKKLVQDQVELTQQDMQEGFESSYGPRVEILAIVLSDQRSAQKIWEMARDNPTDKFFGELAQQYSVEPVSSSNLGKVPPIRKHSGQPAVEKEAFSLKPGELSGIIATGGKYIILRCQGFTEPVVKDPAVVQEELMRDLKVKKTSVAMMNKMELIRESAEIDNFLVAQKKAPRVATKP